jgi:putative two-component system response regulator
MDDAKRRENVLIVDDDPQNLSTLTKTLQRAGMVARPVLTGERAIEAALFEPPDLVLLDVMLPDLSGFEVCRRLKSDERLSDIPVIFLSGLRRPEDKVEGLRAGGVDFVSKPFSADEIVARVQTHLHVRELQLQLQERNEVLERRVAEQVKAATASQMATIFALAKLAEARDDDTGRHIERVQSLARTLAEGLRRADSYTPQIDDLYIDTLDQTASLHDIGKVGITDAVLLKPGPLTDEEFGIMKTHCAVGSETLAKVLERFPDNRFLRMGVDVARSHHERWDGSGYPERLRGDAIPLSARIVAVADVYDALTSNRCYRSALQHEEVVRTIREGSGRQFDPAVVAAFEANEGVFRRIRLAME